MAAPSQREMTQEQTDGSCDVSDDCHHCNFHLEDKYGLYKHNARDGKQTLGLASGQLSQNTRRIPVTGGFFSKTWAKDNNMEYCVQFTHFKIRSR